jgi:hypothetical protein
MQPQYPIAPANLQASPEVAQHLADQLEAFLHPLLLWLDAALDKREVAPVRANGSGDSPVSPSFPGVALE